MTVGLSLTRAIDMHLVSAHVDELASHGIETPVAGFSDILVNHAHHRKHTAIVSGPRQCDGTRDVTAMIVGRMLVHGETAVRNKPA